MPKVSKTIREWTKGLNTYFSPRDIPDECLAKSPSDGSLTVGIYNDKGGLIRLCGQGYDNWQHSGSADAPALDVTCNSGTPSWRTDGRGFHFFSHTWNMEKHALGETGSGYNPDNKDTDYYFAIESGSTHGTYGHVFTDDGTANSPSRTWTQKVFNADINGNTDNEDYHTWSEGGAIRTITSSGYGANYGHRYASNIWGTDVDMNAWIPEIAGLYPVSNSVIYRSPYERMLTQSLINDGELVQGTDRMPGIPSSWYSLEMATLHSDNVLVTSTKRTTNNVEHYEQEGTWLTEKATWTSLWASWGNTAFKVCGTRQYHPPPSINSDAFKFGTINRLTADVYEPEWGAHHHPNGQQNYNSLPNNATTLKYENKELFHPAQPCSVGFVDFGHKGNHSLKMTHRKDGNGNYQPLDTYQDSKRWFINRNFQQQNSAYVIASTLTHEGKEANLEGCNDVQTNHNNNGSFIGTLKDPRVDGVAATTGNELSNATHINFAATPGNNVLQYSPYRNIVIAAHTASIDSTTDDEEEEDISALGWPVNGGSYRLYISVIYDGNQESEAKPLGYLRGLNGADRFNRKVYLSCAVTWAKVADYAATSPPTLGNYDVRTLRETDGDNTPNKKPSQYLMNSRLTGFRIWFANSSDDTEDIYLLAEGDRELGFKTTGSLDWTGWVENSTYPYTGNGILIDPLDSGWLQPDNGYIVSSAGSGGRQYNGKWFQILQPSKLISYEALNGCGHDEARVHNYRCSHIFQGRLYAGNYYDAEFGKWEKDKVVRSAVGQYDNLPSITGKMDITSDSGDSITAINSFGSRLFIFKEKDVFQFDYSNPKIDGRVEFTYPTSGVKRESQIAQTQDGLFWVNDNGAYMFAPTTNNRVINLLDSKIDKNDWDIKNSDEPIVGYDEKNKRVIIVKSANASGKVWFFDLVTQSWTTNNSTGTTDWHTYDGTGSFPTLSGKRVRTNLINNLKGELLYLTDCSVDDNNGNASEDNASVSQTDTHNFVIKKWNDSSKFNKNVNFTTKEFDFGNPHTKKKIHQIYVSYKMNNHEDEVATTDVETWSAQGTAWNVWNVSWNTSQYEGHYSEGFSNIYYGVDSGDLIGDFGESGYGITPTNGFVGTNGNWSIAELIPNRPINCYTFQLQFKANPDGLGIPGTFEINDLTFVYKEKKIKSRLRRNVN